MWLFNSPKNYSEMLKRIATFMFFISLFIIIVLSHSINNVSTFMKSISFDIVIEYDSLKLYISYFYFPLFFAICENIFKLHDRVSDIFNIRYRFDKYIIIYEMLSRLNLKHLYNNVYFYNRDAIMINIFYKYASSTNPQIDRHYIDMALGAWCWYWILLDSIICITFTGLFWLISKFSWNTLIILIIIIVVHFIFMLLLKKFQCRKYALQEVKAILELKNKRYEIRRYLINALQD